MFLEYKKFSFNAIAPIRSSDGAAGYDLCACEDATVGSKKRCLIKTDLAIKVPCGTYGRIAPRSGLALKHGIDVGAGVIDEDYRGNVGIILFNHGDSDYAIKQGERIAQLILEKIEIVQVVEVQDFIKTVRGERGYGSTDKNAYDSGC